jgi:Transposase DDE domain
MIEPGQLATDSAVILSDRTGYLPERQANRRRNPMCHLVREVRVRIETGKVLRLLTNDLSAPAQEIADLYRQRWAIELFFRWVKQTLNITRFFGRGENAVRIQIAVALITYLLLRIAQTTHRLVLSPLRFAQLVRDNLMHRKTLQQMVQPNFHPPNQPDLRQSVLWPN